MMSSAEQVKDDLETAQQFFGGYGGYGGTSCKIVDIYIISKYLNAPL